MRSIVRFAAVSFSVLTLLAACGGGNKNANSPSASSGDDKSLEIGSAAPAFELETVNGKGKVSLEGFQGKPVVVDFWATWCEPCGKSMPKLEELSKKVGDKVAFVGVSCYEPEKKDEVPEKAKTWGVTFPIGWDEGHNIAKNWKVETTMPMTYVVDATGKVRFVHGGYKGEETDKKLEEELNTLVEEASKLPKSETKGGDTAAAGDKPAGDKPAGDTGEKPAGDKPAGDAPSGDAAEPTEKPAGKKKPGKKPGKKKPKK